MSVYSFVPCACGGVLLSDRQGGGSLCVGVYGPSDSSHGPVSGAGAMCQRLAGGGVALMGAGGLGAVQAATERSDGARRAAAPNLLLEHLKKKDGLPRSG